jgi:hypothetical protein
MGGTTVQAQTPTMPTAQGSASDWAAALPTIYQTQLQYAPQQAQQQLDLIQQYGGSTAKALQDAQNSIYPNTGKLQEQLAGQALAGSTADVPDWMKQQYQSNMNAQLGTNAASPIGADYMSRGLLQQKQDWQQYYQNMGLSVAGRQPLTQAGSPQTTDYMSSFTPNSVMTGNNQNYSTAGNIYGSQLNYNQALRGQNMNLIGSAIGAGGSVGMGMAMSSIRYKKDIKKWE